MPLMGYCTESQMDKRNPMKPMTFNTNKYQKHQKAVVYKKATDPKDMSKYFFTFL